MENEVVIEEEVVDEKVFVEGELVAERVEEFVKIDIEGKSHHWEKDVITREEVAILGGWEVSEGVLIIDEDNNERTLAVAEVVRIEVGVSFAKKVRFRRG